MTIKVGDKVRFTEKCFINRAKELGLEGVVERIRSNQKWPYYVCLTDISLDTLKRHQILNNAEVAYDWPMEMDEIELVE